MALTKDDIVGSLQSGLGLSRSESSRYLDTAFELVKSFMAGGDDVLICGFGKFIVRPKGIDRAALKTGIDLGYHGRKTETGQSIRVRSGWLGNAVTGYPPPSDRFLT
jgi:nucleoid DNA-binding protein